MSTNNVTPIIRHPNGNIELTLVIPWADVQTGYEKEVQHAVDNAELTGFRKGKAPRTMVEPKLDKTKVYTAAIQNLIPDVYQKAITDNKLHPILTPNISLKKGDENQDWEFTAVVCEAPEVKLPANYEAEVKKLKVDEKDDKVGKVIEYLKDHIEVTVPDMIVEEEAEHRLSHLVENLSQLGMTTQKYLEAKKLSPEDLRAQTASQARADLAVQFILNAVQAQKTLKNRQDTLDFLNGLI